MCYLHIDGKMFKYLINLMNTKLFFLLVIQFKVMGEGLRGERGNFWETEEEQLKSLFLVAWCRLCESVLVGYKADA